MKHEEKVATVEQISKQMTSTQGFYLADVSSLTVNQTTELRKLCYDNGVQLYVSKNTLIKKALEKINIKDEELFNVLKGPSSIMTSEKINGVAKLIKEFRKKYEKPVLKAAFIEEVLYVGDNNLDTLVNLKTKEELIADVIQLLQSPIRNLIGALNSGANKIMGVLDTLSDKQE